MAAPTPTTPSEAFEVKDRSASRAAHGEASAAAAA